MYTFNEYFNSFNLKEIGAFLPVKGGVFHMNPKLGFDMISYTIKNELFDSSLNYSEFPSIKPYLSFFDKSAQQAIDKGFPRELIINPPDLNEGTKKMEMHKKLEGKKYVPKTVYDVNDINKIGFPIIAKSSQSQAAKGVYKWKTKEEFEKEMKKLENSEPKNKPNFFCEPIDIKQEWRTVCWKRKNGDIYIIYLAERVVNNDKIKSLRENLEFLEDTEYDSNFEWHLINLKKEKLTKHIKTIIEDCYIVNPGITYLAIDFCMDKDSKFWWIECNCAPGASYYLPISAYYHAMEDWFPGKVTNPGIMSKLNKLSKKLIEYTHAIAPVYKVPEFEPDIIGKKIN